MKTKIQSIIERVVTYGVIVICILGMVYYFGSVSTRQKKEVLAKNTELASLKKKITEAEEEKGNRKIKLEDINKQIDKKKDEVNERFEKLLEKSDNYTIFIEQVQRKAKALDILIQNSTYDSPTQSAETSKYLEFKFNATVTGQYNKMKRFLWEVENAMGRLVKISNLEINAPVSDKHGNISMKLTLSTFFKS
ncbi:MAG: type 4a pilus biogenesis protein PilO [Candidatus Riflebacteria bacterium]|nr:type 4a pilus biogenesis protein PilO [Candidatus Riflebacteria bacterium]